MSRYLLRKIAMRDIDFVQEVLGNPEVNKYYGFQIQCRADAEEQMKWYAQLEKENTGQWWVITDKQGNEKVGAIGVNDYSAYNQTAELGFWLKPSRWGRGIIATVFPQMRDRLPESWTLQQLIALVETENMSSLRLCEKLGFTFQEKILNYEQKGSKWIHINKYVYNLSQ